MWKTIARQYWLGFQRKAPASRHSVPANDNIQLSGGERTARRDLTRRVQIACHWSQTIDGLACHWLVDAPAIPPDNNRALTRADAARLCDRAGSRAQRGS